MLNSNPLTWKKRKRRHRRPSRALPFEEQVKQGQVDPGASPTSIHVLAYGPEAFEERNGASVGEIQALRARFPVTWIDITGLADIKLIQQLGEMFQLHPLAMEDVMHTFQRAKYEEYSNFGFFVMRMAPMQGEHETDQLSLFLGDNYVVTFQERPGDCLECVRNRIRSGGGRVRTLGPDYLAYSIIDAAVDDYFPHLESNGNSLEDLEDRLVLYPHPRTLQEVYSIRRKLLGLRRAVWPLREAVSAVARQEHGRFRPETQVFLRDVYDHTVQIIDLMENYRELSSNLMDVYLSSMSNRMNEVMKVLTIISVVFIPLTFIAGVYGMNFRPPHDGGSPYNMPELDWRYGYLFCLGLMLVVAVAEIIYFRKKGWIGPPKDVKPLVPEGEELTRLTKVDEIVESACRIAGPPGENKPLSASEKEPRTK